MLNLRPAKSVQGRVELPVSPDLLFMAALGACAARRPVTIPRVAATDVVNDAVRALQNQADARLDGGALHVNPTPAGEQGELLALPGSLIPYRAIYTFMGLGMGKAVAARAMSEKQLQDAIAQGRRIGLAVQTVQLDDVTALRAGAFDPDAAARANVNEDDCAALLAYLFGRGEKLTFAAANPHLSTPLRQLAAAFGFTAGMRPDPAAADDDPLAKRMKFLKSRQRDAAAQSQTFTVDADFSARGGEPLNIAVPGDEILAAALAVLKCLVPRGDLEIANAPLETWASQTLSFIRKMGGKINVKESAKTAFGPCGALSVQKSEYAGRKVRCAPFYQYAGQLPCMAAAAAFASGKSVFRELGALRLAEPDGLDQLEKCLRPLGVRHGEMPDGIVIEGAKDFDGFDILEPLPAHTAIAFCVAGLKCMGKTLISDELAAARWPNLEATVNEICEFRNK